MKAKFLLAFALLGNTFFFPPAAAEGVDAQTDAIDSAYRPLSSPSALQDLNFYLLTVLERSPDALHALTADDDLDTIRRNVARRAKAARSACEAAIVAKAQQQPIAPQLGCSPDALRWTDTERQRGAAAFGHIFDSTSAVQRLVAKHLRRSGRFQLYAALNDRALAVNAWIDVQNAIDRIIRIYALGGTPKYSDIDSVIYPYDKQYYQTLLSGLIREVARQADEPGPAYNLERNFALELMDANRRDDAVRQAALEEDENAATFTFLSNVQWSNYDYDAILVPGWSPEIAYEPLNPGAKLRLRRGVESFQAGRAPVIIVSGGRLRPPGTTWTEALEMKRFLVSRYAIPSNRILVDALARHTTTNMRNAARLLFRTSAPRDKKSLVIDSIHYIGSPAFAARCEQDLGYLPFTLHNRLDFDTLEFTPSLTSLHREASDPMDP
jgi:DUF218 domain